MTAPTTELPVAANEQGRKALPVRVPPPGLSVKLLVLTILFVMIAEVLIYVPSIANFRMNWLHDRLAVAYTAALVFTAAEGREPGRGVPESAAREILDSIGAKAVAMKTGQQRRLLAVSEVPGPAALRHRHSRGVAIARHGRCFRDHARRQG